MIKTQFLWLSSVLKTRLIMKFILTYLFALRIMLNFPDAVVSAERRLSKLKLINLQQVSYDDKLHCRLSLAMLSIETSCLRALEVFACQKTCSEPS